MALTKVSGGILDPGINVAGVVTATGFSGPFVGGGGVNAGIVTATSLDLNGNGDISGNLVIGGNLTANGDFTTLNTTLREVEILRVDANTTAVAGIITQRGSGDIFSVYDTSTEVFKIADGGNVNIGIGLTLTDNKPASFGNSNDLQIIHQSGENHFLLNSGNTFFKGNVSWGVRNASNQNILQTNSTYLTVDLYGSGSKVLSTSGIGVTIRNGLYIENSEFNMTTNGNKILDFETGGSNVVNFRHNPSDSGNTTFLKATHGGSLELYDDSDGNVKLTTQGSGVFISGALRLQGTESAYRTGQAQPLIYRSGSTSGSYPFNAFGHLIIQTRIDGSNRDIIFATGSSAVNQIVINSNGDMKIPDGKELQFGGPLDSGDGDLRIHHNGTNSFIQNATGDLNIQGDVVRIKKYDGGKTMAAFIQGGQAEFYYDTTRRLTTSPTGINVTGEVEASQDYPNLKPTLDLNFAATKKLDPRISFARQGVASYYDEFGKVKFAADNEPRFDHDPDTGECKGLLIEKASINLIAGSADEGSDTRSVYSTLGNGFAINELVADVVRPTGTPGLVRRVKSHANSNSGGRWGGYSGSGGSPYAGSFWARSVTGTSQVGIDVNDTDYNVTTLTTEWVRVKAEGTTGNNYDFMDITLPNTSDDIYIWGMQLEQNEYASSYIRNAKNSSQAYRGADIANIDGDEFNEFFDHSGADTNDYQGTLISFSESESYVTPNAGRYNKIQLEQNNDNKVQLSIVGGGSPYYDSHITYGTATQSDFTSSQGSTFPTVIKHGVAFAKNNAAYSYNGNTVETDTSVNVGGVSTATHGKYTQLTIGGSPSKAHIKRVMYYSQRISNTQLRNLTS